MDSREGGISAMLRKMLALFRESSDHIYVDYLFSKILIRISLYNLLLQPNTRDTILEYSSNNYRPFILPIIHIK